MKVSIILPSFNRYPLNLYTLVTLENQSFPSEDMEVILIDDGSDDQTPLLKHYKPSYSFKYLRNKLNEGSAVSRNRGAHLAKGKVLIFLDAEMLVEKDFVTHHYNNHLKKENTVVVGGTDRGKIFSFLYPEYDQKQLNRITDLVKDSSLVRDRISRAIGKEVNVNNIKNLINNLKEPVPVLFREDVKNIEQLQPFISPTNNINNLLNYLGDNISTSTLGWMTCAGNISLKRELFQAVGGYEEKFKGWGPEDAEFAYRLKKHGVQFVINQKLKRYHQEHPKQINKTKDDSKNWIIFQEKHPDLDVCIRALSKIQKKNYSFMDEVLREMLHLNKKYPGKYKKYEESLINMLKQIRILEYQDKPIKELLKTSGISDKEKSIIFAQKEEIAAYGKYNQLVKLFDLLTNV